MSLLSNLRSVVSALLDRTQVESDTEEELRAHVQNRADDLERSGLTRGEAERRARIEFGAHAKFKEECREARGGSWLEGLFNDVRFGLRMLRKNPGSTAAVLLALALGIGLNTTVFSFVNALLLRPPAGVKAPDRLLEVWIHNPRSSGLEGYLSLTYPDYVYHRDHNQSFEGMLAFDGEPHTVIWNRSGEGRVVLGQLVSGNFFSLLGVNAVLGRTISLEDDRSANPQPVAVLGHAFWQQSLGSDPSIVGKTLMLNGLNYNVIGVAPSGFIGLLVGFEPDFWAPITMVEQITGDQGRLSNWNGHWLIAVGRLKPEAIKSAARVEASVLEHQIEQDHPDLKRSLDATAFPATLIPAPFRIYVAAFTALLMAVFGLVLLIACANVASFLLARATGRAREMAVRSALGAGRGRLIRQMLVESTLLSGIAALAGLIMAYCAAPLLLALKPASLPIALSLPVDWRVLVFTLLVALICSAAFGLTPALRSSRVRVASNLKDEAQSGGYRKSKLRSLLMIGEIATCTVLLVGGALCVRSLRNASSIDPGFNTEHVIAATFAPEMLGYSQAQVRNFYVQLAEHIKALPGVTLVSFVNHLPLGTAREQSSLTEGTPPTPTKKDGLPVDIFRVAPGYFPTMGIALLRGRDFTTREKEEEEVYSRVAIINKTLAQRLWGNEDPVGKRITFYGEKAATEVIGVVNAGKYRTLGEDPIPVVYLPRLPPRRTLVVRTSGDPAVLLDTVRREIHFVDPNIAATDIETMRQYMTLPLFPARTTGLLLGVSGFLALALTSVGLFGVVSYIVSQRTHEIGVRMALGARRIDVLRLIVKHGLLLTGIGLVIGLGMALGAGQLLSSLLYGIGPTDPATFIGVALLLCVVVLLACYLPARRAMRVDPMVALRYE